MVNTRSQDLKAGYRGGDGSTISCQLSTSI
jgi:hypothetical protein